LIDYFNFDYNFKIDLNLMVKKSGELKSKKRFNVANCCSEASGCSEKATVVGECTRGYLVPPIFALGLGATTRGYRGFNSGPAIGPMMPAEHSLF